jgi:seryl-tRNA synthetase
MLQLATLRNHTDLVKERLAIKNFKEINLVDEIIALDDERKKFTFQFDETKAKINAASKEIGMLMGKGQKEEAEAKKKEVESFKTDLGPIQKN